MKKALITGITGQDGSYLAELLLSNGYAVYGLDRRSAVEDSKQRYSRIHHLLRDITLFSGDIRDYERLFMFFSATPMDEVYHLAAQSHVKISFDDEYTILDGNIKGTVNILNALRKVNPCCKMYHASSSEQFGKVLSMPQNEDTPFNPVSPYAIGKLHSFYYVRMYREAYNLFACNGILFNHESQRRATNFVTRKISMAVARISAGLQKELFLGNLDAKRDWGHAKDYTEAMYLMLQHPTPDDYVIATGETYTVREFCNVAFSLVGLNYLDYVKIDPQLYRPNEVNTLLGDASKAKNILGWNPKVQFTQLVEEMVRHDIDLVKREVKL